MKVRRCHICGQEAEYLIVYDFNHGEFTQKLHLCRSCNKWDVHEYMSGDYEEKGWVRVVKRLHEPAQTH